MDDFLASSLTQLARFGGFAPPDRVRMMRIRLIDDDEDEVDDGEDEDGVDTDLLTLLLLLL